MLRIELCGYKPEEHELKRRTMEKVVEYAGINGITTIRVKPATGKRGARPYVKVSVTDVGQVSKLLDAMCMRHAVEDFHLTGVANVFFSAHDFRNGTWNARWRQAQMSA